MGNTPEGQYRDRKKVEDLQYLKEKKKDENEEKGYIQVFADDYWDKIKVRKNYFLYYRKLLKNGKLKIDLQKELVESLFILMKYEHLIDPVNKSYRTIEGKSMRIKNYKIVTTTRGMIYNFLQLVKLCYEINLYQVVEPFSRNVTEVLGFIVDEVVTNIDSKQYFLNLNIDLVTQMYCAAHITMSNLVNYNKPELLKDLDKNNLFVNYFAVSGKAQFEIKKVTTVFGTIDLTNPVWVSTIDELRSIYLFKNDSVNF